MTKSPQAIRDGVNWFSDAKSLRSPMVNLISANQQLPPVIQIEALAAALTCLCDAVQLDPHKLITQIANAKAEVDSAFATQWRAMAEYGKGELLG